MPGTTTAWQPASTAEPRVSLEWLARSRRGSVVHRGVLEGTQVMARCGLWLPRATALVWPIHEVLPIWPAPKCARCWPGAPVMPQVPR